MSSSLSGGLCCPLSSSPIPTSPPHGGDQVWGSLRDTSYSVALSSDSPRISSLSAGRYFSLSCIAGKCSSTTSYMQPSLWFLIKLGSLILKGQLSISMKILSFHYMALAITWEFLLLWAWQKSILKVKVEQRLLPLFSTLSLGWK